MPEISNFHLQLGGVDFVETAATAFDLLIVESGYHSKTPGLGLSSAEIEALQDQGRTVVAYLNVSVTDHNRGYWTNDAWVNYSDPDNRDVGPVDSSADPPCWLKRNHGEATDGNTTFGYIVDYADETWRELVVAQSIHLITYHDEPVVGSHDLTITLAETASEFTLTLPEILDVLEF